MVKNESDEMIQLTHGNYSSLMESKNRGVRKAAYKALYSNYEQYQHTYAKTLQTNVKSIILMPKSALMIQPVKLLWLIILFQKKFTMF